MDHTGGACANAARFTVIQGDLLLLACGKASLVNKALDRVRQYIAQELKLFDEKQNALLWVTDFPMYEFDEEQNRLEASLNFYHPSMNLEG